VKVAERRVGWWWKGQSCCHVQIQQAAPRAYAQESYNTESVHEHAQMILLIKAAPRACVQESYSKESAHAHAQMIFISKAAPRSCAQESYSKESAHAHAQMILISKVFTQCSSVVSKVTVSTDMISFSSMHISDTVC
jgi:hypothetical protein